MNLQLGEAVYVRDFETKRGVKIEGHHKGKHIIVSYLFKNELITGPCRFMHDPDHPILYMSPMQAAYDAQQEFFGNVREAVMRCIQQNGLTEFLSESRASVVGTQDPDPIPVPAPVQEGQGQEQEVDDTGLGWPGSADDQPPPSRPW